MPELRQDPATQEWVIVATERARRPEDFSRPAPRQPAEERAGPCPFCPGNEHLTPPESLAYRHGPANGPGWWVRVVPNQFPALVPEGSQERSEAVRLFRRMDGVGQREVVIESPDHRGTFCLCESVKGDGERGRGRLNRLILLTGWPTSGTLPPCPAASASMPPASTTTSWCRAWSGVPSSATTATAGGGRRGRDRLKSLIENGACGRVEGGGRALRATACRCTRTGNTRKSVGGGLRSHARGVPGGFLARDARREAH